MRASAVPRRSALSRSVRAGVVACATRVGAAFAAAGAVAGVASATCIGAAEGAGAGSPAS